MKHKNLQVFYFESQEVRIIWVNNEPWWVAKDVCDVLGIQNVTQAIAQLDEDERSMFYIGRQGDTNIISESGLYTLIMRSNKPEARKFRRWVTHEVLPSIFKRGMYMTPQKIESEAIQSALNSKMVSVLTLALEKEQQKVKALESQIKEQESEVNFSRLFKDDLKNHKNVILSGDFKNILREGDMLFIRFNPANGLKGIAPVTSELKEITTKADSDSGIYGFNVSYADSQ